MKKYTQFRHSNYFFIFLCLISLLFPSLFIYQGQSKLLIDERPINNNKILKNNDYSFFNRAFIWGPFEVLFDRHFQGFRVYNPGPYYNKTIHVIGYVSDEGKWVYKLASDVFGAWHIGFIGNHHICIFAFYDVTAF